MYSAKRNRPAIEKGQCAAPPREGRYTPSCRTSTPRGERVHHASCPGSDLRPDAGLRPENLLDANISDAHETATGGGGAEANGSVDRATRSVGAVRSARGTREAEEPRVNRDRPRVRSWPRATASISAVR